MTYARADIDLNRQALMQVFSEILALPMPGTSLVRRSTSLIG